MRAQWLNEKELIAKVRTQKERIEALRVEQEQAERATNLAEASEIAYGRIPEVQKQLDALHRQLTEMQKDESFLREEVTDEDIALVVSKWTGIPVAKMLESEMKKLLHMEQQLAGARGRPTGSAGGRSQCRPAFPCRAVRRQPSHRFVLVPGPDRGGQGRSSQKRSPKCCSMTIAPSCAST